MENEFDNEVLGFGGQVAHICYFLHIINLIANSLVHESDINKKRRDRKPTRFFDENAKKISLKAGSMRLRD